MDFSLTDEQRAYRAEVLRVAREHLCHDLAARDLAHGFSAEDWKRCADLGIQGLPVPEAYGGQGADPVTIAVALEALGQGCEDNGLIFSLNAHMWSCALPLVRFGDDAQRARWLPRLSDGSAIGVQAMTEPDTGSDAYALSTRVAFEGDRLVLNGAKTFVTNAPVADVFVVFATTDPAKGVGGLCAVLVERDAPGLHVTSLRKMGLRTSPMGEVALEDCAVPAGNLLGGPGAGLAVFSTSIDWERSFILAAAVGSMQRQLDGATAYARDRHQFGQPIGSFQAVSHKLADMQVRLDAARLMLYRLAWDKAQGRRTGSQAARVKLFLSESFLHSSLDTLQVHGGLGYLEGTAFERDVRDAIAGRIYSGTSEIQRNIVARGLGL